MQTLTFKKKLAMRIGRAQKKTRDLKISGKSTKGGGWRRQSWQVGLPDKVSSQKAKGYYACAFAYFPLSFQHPITKVYLQKWCNAR
ncbi:hypothetical protein [Alcaligenes faecalis]|uniref:hypothetical protein n=1 Tax=Alcaligenes faecalis TaxID=511 RepID=UPI0029339D67|nr:hypothetical protein [Alcaligenes faecalis]MDV2115867.1 hypothetical protein [Alcaligenes faecalis]